MSASPLALRPGGDVHPVSDGIRREVAVPTAGGWWWAAGAGGCAPEPCALPPDRCGLAGCGPPGSLATTSEATSSSVLAGLWPPPWRIRAGAPLAIVLDLTPCL
jgi:hypothetical protein